MNSEKFIFFWNGPFSQWHPCDFTVGETRYNCAEQFMMHAKALLFGDHATANKVLESKSPRSQKELGRKVQGFNGAIWTMFREGIVFTANYAKFGQNPDLLDTLLKTRGTTLVEASPKDQVWGIGLAEDDPRALDRAQWLGSNLLGEALVRVRETLIEEIKRGTRQHPIVLA